MGPIDYTIDSVDPISGMLEGLKAGTEIRQFQEARTLEEQQKERINQYRDSMTDYMQNPTIDKLRNLQATFPEQDKAFKPLLDQMDKKQLQAEQSAGTQIISAIKQNDLGTAHKVLDLAIESGKNSGIDTSSFEMVKQSLDQNPTGSLGVAQWMLYHTMPPEQQEKFAKAQQMIEETSQSEKLFPSKLREQTAKAGTAESEATIKGLEAKIAPEKLQAEYKKTLAETNKLLQEPEFEKQRLAIARQKNEIDHEGNIIARQTKQLTLMKMQQDYLDKVNEKTSKVYSAYDNTVNAKNTIDKALSFFKSGDAQRAHGAIAGKYIPTVRQGTKDYEKILETIGSQSFLKAVQEAGGMSGLTEVEGQKLQSAAANLSLEQSGKQAKQNLILLKSLLGKSFKNIEKKFGINVKQSKSKDRRNISGADAASALGI